MRIVTVVRVVTVAMAVLPLDQVSVRPLRIFPALSLRVAVNTAV